jgi:hypothetical protein
MAKKDSNTSVKVEKTETGGRVTATNKKTGLGVYAEAGGKAPDHNNPKGEKRGGIGISIGFGGAKKNKKK